MHKRSCGDCQLCCKLLPVAGLPKPANTLCRFQKFHKGCSVYRTAKMPPECGLWNCRWLINDDAGELSRPDRAHYVIDVLPDFVTVTTPDGDQTKLEVVQIWIDPDYPDAHHDPALRRWLFRRAQAGIAALIRFNERDAVTLIAPPFTPDGEWLQVKGGREKQHSPLEILTALDNRALLTLEDCSNGDERQSGAG